MEGDKLTTKKNDKKVFVSTSYLGVFIGNARIPIAVCQTPTLAKYIKSLYEKSFSESEHDFMRRAANSFVIKRCVMGRMLKTKKKNSK